MAYEIVTQQFPGPNRQPQGAQLSAATTDGLRQGEYAERGAAHRYAFG